MKTRIIFLVLITIVCGSLAHAATGETPKSTEVPHTRTVAVFDLRNIGTSVALEPLRKALARMLTTDLSTYGQIEVVARERVASMIGETQLGESGLVSGETAQRAGRALDADCLVQGTFAGSADGIKVHVDVLDVASGQVIGTGDQSGIADDVTSVEARLLQSVATALKLGKPVPEPAKPSGKSETLAILYLQNLSPDAKLDPMEIGFTDTLISYLQDRPGIVMVEREQLRKVLDELRLQKSTLSDGSQSAKIGQMLGAHVLLLGSYLVTKDSIRFDAHLTAADTGMLIQAVSATGSTTDLDAPLKSLAEKIASALAAKPRTIALDATDRKTSVEAMLHYSRALELDQEQRYAEVIDELQRCIYLDPTNTEARARLGMLYCLRTHEYAKGAGMLDSVVKVNNDYYRQYAKQLAFAYDGCGKLEEERAVLTRLFEDKSLPDDQRADAAFWQAKSYASDWTTARPWYERALALTKDVNPHANIRMHLAGYHAQAGDIENALLQYEAVLNEVPANDDENRHFFVSESITRLGERYEQAKSYDRAKKVFGQAIVRYAGTKEAVEAQFQFGRVAESTGHAKEAAEAFEDLAEKSPQAEKAPQALLNAAGLRKDALGDAVKSAALIHRVAVRYGSNDHPSYYGPRADLLMGLLPPLSAPFEPGRPRPALLDESHAQFSVHDVGGGGIWASALRSVLMANGNWVHVNDSTVTQSLLAGYSLLSLNTAYAGGRAFSNEEIEAVRNFVAAGGGLLVILNDSRGGEGTDYLQYDPLLAVLGARQFRGVTTTDVTAKVEAAKGDAAGTRDITIGGDIPVRVPKQAITGMYQGRPSLIAFHYGLGRVVLSSGYLDGLKVLDGAIEPAAEFGKAPYLDAIAQWLRAKSGQDAVRGEFESALRHIAEGDASAGLAGLRRITADHPGTRWSEEARLLSGNLLRAKGDLQAASSEYADLADSAKTPDIQALARLNLARCYAADGQGGSPRALAECWKVWHADTSNPWAATALIESGQRSYKAEKLEEAQKAFDTVMNSVGHCTDKLTAMVWSAVCKEKLGDLAGAARIYTAIAVEYPALNMPVPGDARARDVREYARVRAQELKQ